MSLMEIRIAILAAGLHCIGDEMLYPVVGDLLLSLDKADICVDQLCDEAIRLKMLPMVAKLDCDTERWGGEDFSQLNEVFRIAQDNSIRVLGDVVGLFTNETMPLALLKGSDIIARNFYAAQVARQMEDIDVLLLPHDLDKFSNMMWDVGFQQGNLDQETMHITALTDHMIQETLETHYEIPSFFKIHRLEELEPYSQIIDRYIPKVSLIVAGRYVHHVTFIDPHFNLSLSIHQSDVWRDSSQVEFMGRNVDVLSPEVLVWFLAGRAYIETYSSKAPALRAFLDLVSVISRYHSTIDWNAVEEVGEKYGMQVSLYYTLARVRSFVDDWVPETVLSNLKRAVTGELQGEDKGDFMFKILGQPLLAPLYPSSNLQFLSDGSTC